jgi:four helix bundle protein
VRDTPAVQDFHKLIVWQRSMDLVESVYSSTNAFPSTERFGLTAQLRRAVVSIPSNIAEGCGRGSSKELVRYLRIATGSSCEVETQLRLAARLRFTSRAETDALVHDVEGVRRMITALIDRIDPQTPTDN